MNEDDVEYFTSVSLHSYVVNFKDNGQQVYRKRRRMNPTRTNPTKMKVINQISLSAPSDDSSFNNFI